MNSFDNNISMEDLSDNFMQTWIANMKPDYTVEDEIIKQGIFLWINYMESLHGHTILESPLVTNFLAANTEYEYEYENYENYEDFIEKPDKFEACSDDSDQSEIDDYEDNTSCKSIHDQRDFSPEPSRFASIYTLQEPPFQRRMRLPNPCDNCRKAKRRCDEKDTCWKCKKNNQICQRIPSAREKRRQEKKNISTSRLEN